jgi:hypothetical protein
MPQHGDLALGIGADLRVLGHTGDVRATVAEQGAGMARSAVRLAREQLQAPLLLLIQRVGLAPQMATAASERSGGRAS